MMTVDEAVTTVIANSGRQPAAAIDLAEALGTRLAGAIVADRDSPPFTKSLVDGFAVVGDDLAAGGPKVLTIVETIAAGQIPTQSIRSGQTTQIMTGAPLPMGAQAIVMVERSRRIDVSTVELDDPSFQLNQHIMAQGREYRAGATVLPAGELLSAASIGLCASVGAARPMVYRPTTVAILSTGDEIVAAGETPGPGQIRNSNGPLLRALTCSASAEPTELGIAGDRLDELTDYLRQGLQHDVLLLTGGVSMGAKDLAPQALAALGVRMVFHKVNLKPGKPVWFGMTDQSLVFALPGNPVSVLACFELFVRTALRARMGDPRPAPRFLPAALMAGLPATGDRQTFLPGRAEFSEAGLMVSSTRWHGSPDLAGLTHANVFINRPAHSPGIGVGESVKVLPLDSFQRH